MPVHEGHLLIIEAASQLVDELTVLLCSHEGEPIEGKLRLRWLRDSVATNINVQWLHKDRLNAPSDEADLWDKWRCEIAQFGRFDKIFGGDDVVEFGRQLDMTPVPLGRDLVDISATKIRETPAQYWAYIPGPVRAYFQRRIVLLGPESVGKSTMTQLLATRYQHSPNRTHFMSEYGRTYDETLKSEGAWVSDDFKQITMGHIALRKALSKWGSPIFIEDTDYIQTIAWEQHLIGSWHPENYPKGEEADLYLLLSPNVPWVNDGTRVAQYQRQAMYDFLKGYLNEHNLTYVCIDATDWSERLQQAIDAIEQ